MKKLHYRKTSDFSLDIDLENGYCIRADALYNYDLKRYAITFYIKENTIDTYHAIETLNNEKISFDGDRKTVKIDILQYVSCLLSQNYFDNCINNCEFETKCFDKGNELFEEEQYIRKIKGGAA